MSAAPLLATKLGIPAARPNAVPRPRLLARLDDGLQLGRRLTLVSAPAGFGKTTLISQWVESLRQPAAWLSLEEGDDDPARLAAYLAEALGGSELLAGGEPSGMEPKDVVQALINRLASAGAERALVLEDYHTLRNFAAHDLVAFLLTHQPPCFHLVIGTREDPPLPLARLRARDQVTEIRERHLRLTPDEVAAFFKDTLQLSLAPASVATLATRTEGWITALQLAGVAVSASANAEGFVAAFAGDDRYIVDYFMEEVLKEQPEHLAEFMRETSILERLCAPLCDTITGRDGSQILLERLDADNYS